MRIGWRGHPLLRQEPAIHVRDCDGGSGRSQVNHQNRPSVIQLKESRPSPAWQTPSRSINDPLLADQLLSDKRNRTALEPGNSRQIGSGNRLATANQVQNNSAVNVTSSPAGSHLRTKVHGLYIVSQVGHRHAFYGWQSQDLYCSNLAFLIYGLRRLLRRGRTDGNLRRYIFIVLLVQFRRLLQFHLRRFRVPNQVI